MEEMNKETEAITKELSSLVDRRVPLETRDYEDFPDEYYYEVFANSEYPRVNNPFKPLYNKLLTLRKPYKDKIELLERKIDELNKARDTYHN